MNVKENSWLKVKSSVIRLVKHAFLAANISMPDDAREVIFPEGIPVHWIRPDSMNQPLTSAPVPTG